MRPVRFRVLLAVTASFFAAASEAQNMPPLRPGFPVRLSGAGPIRATSPAVGDLDNDGVQEIVIGTANRRVYALRANGTVMTGWPITMPAELGAAPALGDVDKDGFLDIVVACGSTLDPTGSGAVRAYRRDGSLIWNFTPLDRDGDGRAEGVISTPALGDVDGDGALEVAFGSWDYNLYLLRGADGTVLPGFPPNPSGLGFGLRDTVWSSPALADLDHDGKLEVIIGVDTHAEGPPINTPDGGALYVFRWNGSLFPGFPRFVNQTIMSAPAVGDIDGDGLLDIVVGGGVYYTGAVGRRVYAFRRDGTFLPGWPVTTALQVFNSPALADLTGDGVLDVVISEDRAPNQGSEPDPFLYAFSGAGALLWQMRPRSYFAVTPNLGNPVVADVTGDGQPDILVPVNTEIAVISRTGVQLTDPGPPPAGDPRPSYYTNTAVGHAPVVTDLEGDGVLDVVAGSGDPFPSPTDATVYVWNPAPVGPAPWPAFRKESQRRAYGPRTAPPPAGNLRFHTVTPCRSADTRLNAAPLAAGSVTALGLAARCGIPPTARAVAVNVTVTQAGAIGDLRVFPAGGAAPLASTINFRAGQTRANNAVLPLSANGDLAVRVAMPSGAVHVLIDVFGYFQ